MQFLKTLFWVVLAVAVVLFANANWYAVEIRLWGGLVADIKLPILLLAFFLIGFLPTLLIHRARIWGLKRRLEPLERGAAPVVQTAPAPAAAAAPGSTDGAGEDETRLATDTKVWPTP